MSDSELRIGAGVPAPEMPPAPVQPPARKPSRGPWILAAAVVLAIGLTALAAAMYLRPSSPAVPSTQAASGSPSSKVKTASVQQYAGKVNGPIKSVREVWKKYEDNDCVLAAKPDFACELGFTTTGITLQTLVAVIDGAAKPGVPAYIGAPPEELASLVGETRARAQKIADMIPEIGEPISTQIRAQVWSEMSGMETIFDRWEPYI